MAFQPNYPFDDSSIDQELNKPAVPANISASNPWLLRPPALSPVVNRPKNVKFTDSPETLGANSSMFLHQKRKASSDFHGTPAKIQAIEEKVAAQLKNMHISNNVGDQGNVDKGSNHLPTLTLSKEVLNITGINEPPLPEVLVPKLSKPEGVLMLWKPPAGSFTSQLFSFGASEDVEDSDNNNIVTSNALNTSGGSTDMEM